MSDINKLYNEIDEAVIKYLSKIKKTDLDTDRLMISAVVMFGEGMKESISDEQFLSQKKVKYLAENLQVEEILIDLAKHWVSLKSRKVGDIKFMAYVRLNMICEEKNHKEIVIEKPKRTRSKSKK